MAVCFGLLSLVLAPVITEPLQFFGTVRLAGPVGPVFIQLSAVPLAQRVHYQYLAEAGALLLALAQLYNGLCEL